MRSTPAADTFTLSSHLLFVKTFSKMRNHFLIRRIVISFRGCALRNESMYANPEKGHQAKPSVIPKKTRIQWFLFDAGNSGEISPCHVLISKFLPALASLQEIQGFTVMLPDIFPDHFSDFFKLISLLLVAA